MGQKRIFEEEKNNVYVMLTLFSFFVLTRVDDFVSSQQVLLQPLIGRLYHPRAVWSVTGELAFAGKIPLFKFKDLFIALLWEFSSSNFEAQ